MSKITRKPKSPSAKAAPRLGDVAADLETVEAMQRLIKRHRARLARLSGTLKENQTGKRREQFREMLEDFDTVTAHLLNTLNDSKWASIILRAELNRREHGPTFDDPEKLRKYLATT